MKILMLGSGKGSWMMRGQQLGDVLGARVTSAPTPDDWAWADVVVLVKRAILQFGRQAKRCGKPVVWDALDFWAQPAQNRFDQAAAIAALRQMAEHAAPALIICATQAMADACDGVYVPHHGRLDLLPTEARTTVQTVGYDGGEVFLDAWAPALRQACSRRGWRFVVNPPRLADVDILVALRGGVWDGWICREWKSGVKAVNAILAGRPLIAQDSAAVREIEPIGSIIDGVDAIDQAFDVWDDVVARQAVADASRTRATEFYLTRVAGLYADQLQALLKAVPA
jgi:hypothetical protein